MAGEQAEEAEGRGAELGRQRGSCMPQQWGGVSVWQMVKPQVVAWPQVEEVE